MDLTPENFIKKIKNMDKADRNKLKLKELVDLIVLAPVFTYDENAAFMNLQTEVTRLAANFTTISDMAHRNQRLPT